MGYIALNCPNCGAQLDLDDNRDFGFCQYCGTKVVREKTIIEHTGTVKIEGMADADSLLDRAFILIESGDFDKADVCLDKVLALNPKCAKAYMGELLCQLKLNDMEQLRKHSKPLNKYSNYNNAVRFAKNEELVAYKDLQTYNYRVYEDITIEKEELISGLEKKFNAAMNFIDRRKAYNKILNFLVDNMFMLYAADICFLCFSARLKSKIGVLVFLVLFFSNFFIKKYMLNKKLEYEDKEKEMNDVAIKLRQERDEYALWLEYVDKTE